MNLFQHGEHKDTEITEKGKKPSCFSGFLRVLCASAIFALNAVYRLNQHV
jgi:hypothetical protein